jgi:uncharacterized protein (TIGR02266 family)
MEKRTILLVDDVNLFLEQEKSFFNQGEFRLLSAHNGVEALKMVTEEHPELVFMDLNMPVMDGDKCCFTIKADKNLNETPVVMVIQGGKEEDFERCWQAGCDDIIAKPLNRNFFLAVTKRYLNIEFRKSPRYMARLSISYCCGTNPEKVLADYSVNMSTGGVFIETDNILPVDSLLTVEFTLRDNPTAIKCTGRVAWLNHPEALKNQNLPVGMGLQFVGLSLDDMNTIRQFIKEQSLLPAW